MTLNGCADSSGNEGNSFRLVRVSNRNTGRRIDIAQNFEEKPSDGCPSAGSLGR